LYCLIPSCIRCRWANSALVVSVTPEDCEDLLGRTGTTADPLLGVRWQQVFEREAARRGGGNLVCPVQRVTDFMAGSRCDARAGSVALPSSSYRLGVKSADCHDIYPPFVTEVRATASMIDVIILKC